MQTFRLPPPIAGLAAARNALRDHYRRVLTFSGSDMDLAFPLDGDLATDMGMAIAFELFDLCPAGRHAPDGIDGHAPDGRTVQVKTTATRQGPMFVNTGTLADHLLFLDLNLDTVTGTVMFNGPAQQVRRYLPESFCNQRMVTRRQIIDADRLVGDHQRLPVVRDLDEPSIGTSRKRCDVGAG